jgi:hypothetical protein
MWVLRKRMIAAHFHFLFVAGEKFHRRSADDDSALLEESITPIRQLQRGDARFVNAFPKDNQFARPHCRPRDFERFNSTDASPSVKGPCLHRVKS